MTKRFTRKGTGPIAQIANALGFPFRRWLKQREYDERLTVRAIQHWLSGRKVHGYKSQMALRDLLNDLGFNVNPREPLPPPETLKRILEKHKGDYE